MGALATAARRAAPKAILPTSTPLPVQHKAADFDWDEDHPGWTVITGRGTAGPHSFEGFVIEGFRGNAIVRSCLDQIVTSASEAPLEAYNEILRDGQQELERAAGSPLDQLLTYPNDRDPGLALVERGLQHYYLGGNLVWEKLRGFMGRPEALVPIHPGRLMGAVTDEYDVPLAYMIRSRDGVAADREVPAEDIVLIPDIDPLNAVFGLPRLLAAAQQLDVDKLASDYVSEILSNHGTPGLIIGVEKGVREEELDRAEEKFEEKFGPKRGRGKMAVVSGGKMIKEIGFSLKDLELPGVRIITGERICAVFDIDPKLIGLGSASKGGSSLGGNEHTEARHKLWVQTIQPLYRRLTAYLDMQLAPEFGYMVIRPNYDNVSALAEGRNEVAKRTETMGKIGVFSAEELRAEMGHDPELPDGQEPHKAAAAPPQLAPGDPDDLGDGKRLKQLTAMRPVDFLAVGDDTDTKAHWKRWDGYVSFWQPDMYQAALALFIEYEGKLVAATGLLEDEQTDAGADPAPERKEGGVTEASVIAWQTRMGVLEDEYHQAWLARFKALITSTTEVVGAGVAGELGVSFNLFDSHIQAMIDGRANLLAGGVTDTTFGAIKDSMALGMEAGESTTQLAGRVSSVFKEGYFRVAKDGTKYQVLSAPQRAALIARTEASGAVNGAAWSQAVASKLPVTKEWVTQGDDRVRDKHTQMEGETVKIDDVFSDGSDYPNDPNERCTMLFHVTE